MKKQIVNKSVSFNVTDPYQKEMKEFVERFPNFSGYVKRLIQRDMEDGHKKAPVQPVIKVNGAVKQYNVRGTEVG